MGKKITVDSSTLVNKILELVEAQKLFKISEKKLDVIIHPDSLVHAVVIFNNGITKMVYHPTTMIVPIANAIFDGKLNIDEFSKKIKRKILKIYFFKKLIQKNFQL